MMVFYADGSKSTTQYARYLIEQHLGRLLVGDETVDHINGDRTDDRLENLQVLSLSENAAKSAVDPEWFEFNCPVCGIACKKRANKVRHNRKQGKAGPFCGRSCAAKSGVR